MSKLSLPSTAEKLESLIKKDSEGNRIVPIQWYKIDMVFEDELASYPQHIQDLYEYDEETRTYTLPEFEWLKWREHDPHGTTDVCIGGSAIAALYDGSELSERLFLYEGQHGSKYMSSIELWYEKTGQTLELSEKKNDDVLSLGHIEEPSIRKWFKKKFQEDHPEAIVEVINDTHMYQSSEISCCLCDFDGIVIIDGIKGILECKTCQFGSEDYDIWKSGNVPLKYYLQVCWYMMCANVPYAYVCVKIGFEIIYIYVERNFEIEELIKDMALEFVQCVRTGKEPDVTGQDVDRIHAFWRRKMGNIKPGAPVVVLDPSLATSLKDINALNAEAELLQERLVEISSKRKAILNENIFPVFGESTFGICDISDDEVFKIKLKNARAKQATLDLEKLKEEEPDLYEHYSTLVPKFNTTLFKKERKEDYERFMVPDTTLTDAKMDYCEITVEPKVKKKGA